MQRVRRRALWCLSIQKGQEVMVKKVNKMNETYKDVNNAKG